jgi:hypothetical protein
VTQVSSSTQCGSDFLGTPTDARVDFDCGGSAIACTGLKIEKIVTETLSIDEVKVLRQDDPKGRMLY